MINVRNYNFKKLLSKQIYISYLRWSLLILLFINASIFGIWHTVYKDVVIGYKDRVMLLEYTEGEDINLLCNAINCKYVTINGSVTYSNVGGILKKYDNTITKTPLYAYSDITHDMLTTVSVGYKTFYVDDRKFINLTTRLCVFINIIVILMFTIICLIKITYSSKTDVMESNIRETELTTRLSRDLTESLHHELAMPVALIKTLTNELFAKMYPCPYTKDGVCSLDVEGNGIDECKNCVHYLHKRAIDDIAIDRYKKIKYGIFRIEAVLHLIAGAKHIKYSNGTVPIYNILDNIVSSINSYKVTKIKADFVNKELMLKHAVGYGMSNGDMLNVINIMVTNSIEAKATHVTFIAEYLEPDKVMYLYVKDNGRGIRDANDKIVSDDDIFKYGFSTKDDNGEQLVATNWLERILLKFGINVINSGSPRGVGLSLTKGILINAGGDIIITDTSVAGTTFRITMPIKDRRYEN